jgi:hypothetical protein
MALTIVELAQGMPMRVATRLRVGGGLQPPHIAFPAFRAGQRPDLIFSESRLDRHLNTKTTRETGI